MKSVLGTLFISLFVLNLAQAAPLAVDRADVPEVAMGHYLIGSASTQPLLQTVGLATCVGVSIYDPQLRQGALLHVTASSLVHESISEVLRRLTAQGSLENRLQVQMYGGWARSMGLPGDAFEYESDRVVGELLAEFERRQILVLQNVTLATPALLEKGRPAVFNLEMNFTTGQVYRFQPSVNYRGPVHSQPLPAQ